MKFLLFFLFPTYSTEYHIIHTESPEAFIRDTRIPDVTFIKEWYRTNGLKTGENGKAFKDKNEHHYIYRVHRNPDLTVLYYPFKKELVLKKTMKKLCKFRINDTPIYLTGLEVCIPEKGEYYFGTNGRSGKNGTVISTGSEGLVASYKLNKILEDDIPTKENGSGEPYPLVSYETPLGTLKNKMWISKYGKDTIRRRSKIFLKKNPDLIDFIKGLNTCLKKFDEKAPCSKRYLFNHQYYGLFIHGSFITHYGDINAIAYDSGSKNSSYVPTRGAKHPEFQKGRTYYEWKLMNRRSYHHVLDTTEKALKNIYDHLVYDAFGRIYLTQDPELFRIHIVKRNNKWQIKAIDGYSQNPYNYGYISEKRESNHLQWEE